MRQAHADEATPRLSSTSTVQQKHQMNTQKPIPAPDLTDAECDLILRRLHASIRLDREAINTVDLTLYRRSQYLSLAAATIVRATVRVDDLLGYTSALDALYAMARTVDLLDHRASEDDVRVIITVNRTATLPECWLADASTEIHRHLIRTGNYTVTQ